MPKLEIEGLVGVSKAAIDIEGIAMVCGQTGAGKTTVADAARAVLTGTPAMRGITQKKQMDKLLRKGFEEATVSITEGLSQGILKYPKGEYLTSGDPVASNEYVTGNKRFGELSLKERMAAIQEVAGATPTKKDLREVVGKDLLDDENFDKVWKFIQVNGWDGGHKKMAENELKAKGAWEAAAGEKYGSAKAEKLAGEPKADADTIKSELETAWAALKEVEAGAQRATLEAQAEGLSEVQERLEREEDEISDLMTAVQEEEERWMALPKPSKTTDLGLSCPHCAKDFRLEIKEVNAGTREYAAVLPGDLLGDSDTSDAQQAVDEAKTEVAKAKAALQQKHQSIADLRAVLNAKRDAAAALARIEGQEADEEAIAGLRDRVEAIQAQEKAAKSRDVADEAHKKVLRYQAIASAIAIDGVRATVLARSLKEFNKRLQDACSSLKCEPAEVFDSFAYWFKGRPYELLSRGEKMVADAVFQIAARDAIGEGVIVVDDVDAASGPMRSGLLVALRNSKAPALVCVAIAKKEGAPDLAKMGVGRTYWLEDGAVEAL
jgi:DNA repair exonuclease SbcCD ATPase subunit